MFERLIAWWRGLFRPRRTPRTRTTGMPPSPNGASSFHLWWDLPEIPLREVAVTLEITEPPKVDHLYFFALQASFMRRTEQFGGAHLGLQWNARHPENRAINWGGYDEIGAILTGTRSPLPSRPNDPNTRDYVWQPNKKYRLRIGPAQPSATGQVAWPGAVTDLDRGETVVVRELLTGGDALRSPVMWMEVFADCADPSVIIRWSDLVAMTTDGTELRPHSCRTAYQKYEDGGCTNTASAAGGGAFIQQTAAERTTPPDALLSLG